MNIILQTIDDFILSNSHDQKLAINFASPQVSSQHQHQFDSNVNAQSRRTSPIPQASTKRVLQNMGLRTTKSVNQQIAGDSCSTAIRTHTHLSS